MNNSKNLDINKVEKNLPTKQCILIGKTRVITLDKTIVKKLEIDDDSDVFFTQEVVSKDKVILRKI